MEEEWGNITVEDALNNMEDMRGHPNMQWGGDNEQAAVDLFELYNRPVPEIEEAGRQFMRLCFGDRNPFLEEAFCIPDIDSRNTERNVFIGRSLFVPDIERRRLWLLVYKHMDIYLPQEILVMITRFICHEMIPCQRAWCDELVSKSLALRSEENFVFCSTECCQAYKYSRHVLAEHLKSLDRHLNHRNDQHGLAFEYDFFRTRHVTPPPPPQQPRRVKSTCETCKVCKKEFTKLFKKPGYCGKGCFKKRWKK